MPTTREDRSERRCRQMRTSGASGSFSLQEPQVERREHQDNPDVHRQALPEPMPEEQDVDADHDGYQREHVKHDACLPSHGSSLLLDVVGGMRVEQELSVVRPARQWSPSQREDQVAYGGGLGEEGVVAGVELHDTARPTGELALQLGGGAPVLCADEVRRGHVLPGR